MRLTPRDLVYRAYERRLEAEVRRSRVPSHVGVILDGNRRWARAMGYADAAEGHRRGAEKIDELLAWCEELGIPVVTLWLLSTENLGRDPEEVGALLSVIEEKVRSLALDPRWRIRALGALELLPGTIREAVRDAEDRTAGRSGPC